MSEAETEKKRFRPWKKIRVVVLVVALLCAAVYVPAKLLAVKYTNRGTKLCNEGKFDEAMAQYERAMKFYPRFKPARIELAGLCNEKADGAFARNDFAEAERLYRRVIGLDVEVSDVHYKLAMVCQSQGKKAEGLVEIKEHLKQMPNDVRALRLQRILRGEKPTAPAASPAPTSPKGASSSEIVEPNEE